MAVFQVDSEALAAKSMAVQGTIGRLQAEVNTMQSGLRELESLWTGAAAANFQQLVTDWRATQLKVEESLASINAALSHASQQYLQAEEANARMFLA
ncbi:WXG100 family type VII secretion target [Arthrobacter sulfonylureivorans]|uniref:ESAT-6-like protein n=1 Tax=Arthrobacter sulfonylureivorans TaxID=2486855 RepID=A0ABY3W8E2_9MICC|nr:WXG100 family type VII secretion target [Arthrobacter sulfonylureivorans]UNK45378.1 WXG100 family type VII secretion target [Arthrobacter sulfonylureivorans]